MMRLLVACPSCHRQYDASDRTPGDRFHCRCGETIVVPKPRSHSASVVRCSSCGATRRNATHECSHCGSDFTLHERDLHTICPGCMARVSDRAAFCHHCALRLDPQEKAGEATEMACPACDEPRFLTSRDFGVAGLSILECPSCAGLWLGHGAFRHLVEQAATAPASAPVHVAAAARAKAKKAAPRRRLATNARLYRRCVECSQLMHRRNYDEKSGVIIDVCHDHGVWFDSDELASILRWIRDGGSRRAGKLEAERLADRRHRTGPTTVPGTFPPMSRPTDGIELGSLLEFLLQAGALLFRLIR